MCQLCFINLGDRRYNSVYTLLQNTINSRLHQDGVGWHSGETLFKTHISPLKCSNLGTLINKSIKVDTPIISHVRQASAVYKDKIADDKAHPFESENLVLAHNGTLVYTGVEEIPEEKNLIDSEKFFYVLNKQFLQCNKNILVALPKAMEDFTGKFAFLILDKTTKDYYVVRGRTATLFKVNTVLKTPTHQIKGVLVNTETEDFAYGLRLFSNYVQLFGSELEHSQIEELPKETILKLEDNELVKKGEIKEIDTVVRTGTCWSGYSSGYAQHTWEGTGVTRETEENNLLKAVAKLAFDYYLTIDDIERLYFELMSKPVFSTDFHDMKIFLEKLKTLVTESDSKNGLKRKLKLREKYEIYLPYPSAYYKIQFPWFLTPYQELRTFLSHEVEKRKGVIHA